MSADSSTQWYLPGSVLNALWGNIMPRLAASVWLGKLVWPPRGVHKETLSGGLVAYTVYDEAMELFANQLVNIAFRHDEKESWADVQSAYKMAAERRDRLTNSQRSTLVATEYFNPGVAEPWLQNRPPDGNRMRLRVVEARGYDFVLSNQGLDVFVPPKPGSKLKPGDEDNPEWGIVEGPEEQAAAREDVLQFYKFRETSKPPIGLPRAPATAFPDRASDDARIQHPQKGYFITIPQLTAPTGAHQVPEGWVRGMAQSVDWWVSGSLYRGIMAAFPRIVASKWYEEVTWDRSSYGRDDFKRTYQHRFDELGGLKEMLEERVETVLPDALDIYVPKVGKRPTWVTGKNDAGWNPLDIMITSDGIYFPEPGPAPEWPELARAIEVGVAGNPVFTDSVPCQK